MQPLLLLGSVLVTACAATIKPKLTVTYSDPEGVSARRIALLPVRAGEGLKGFRQMTADTLFRYITDTWTDYDVMPAAATLEALDAAGLGPAYGDMIDGFVRDGMIDRKTLRAVGQALGVDHLLQVELSYAEGERLGGNKTTGFHTVSYQNLTLAVHLLSTEKAALVWEASGGARVSAGIFSSTRRVSEIVAAASRKIAEDMPPARAGPGRDGADGAGR